MAVNTTWSSPATAGGSGGIDLAAGDTLSETVWDRTASDLYRLGGTDGNAKTGPLQIGSTQTYSNASNTAGLTINQTAADDEAWSLKSDDVAHGVTGRTETNTYGRAMKVVTASGGLAIEGLTEDTQGLSLTGTYTNAVTTHTAASAAAVMVVALQKSGTGTAAMSANANILAVQDGSVGTRFIVDAEGNFFSDDTGSVYDGYDDLALVEAFDLRRGFAAWRDARRDLLVRAGILAPDDAAGNRGFVNWTNLLRLHNGAFRQLAARLAALEARTPPLLTD